MSKLNIYNPLIKRLTYIILLKYTFQIENSLRQVLLYIDDKSNSVLRLSIFGLSEFPFFESIPYFHLRTSAVL